MKSPTKLFIFFFLPLLVEFSVCQQVNENRKGIGAIVARKKCQEYITHRFSFLGNNSKSELDCRIKPTRDYRLSEGPQEATQGEFPHLALIGRIRRGGVKNDEIVSIEWFCSGSLISEYFVLTSLACSKGGPTQPTQVRLGALSLSDTNSQTIQNYTIGEIIIHPDTTTKKSFDNIALLKLTTKVEFSPSVIPVCLYTLPEIDPNIKFAIASGLTNVNINEGCAIKGQSNVVTYDKVYRQPLELANDIHKCDETQDDLEFSASFYVYDNTRDTNPSFGQLNPDKMICSVQNPFSKHIIYGSPLQIQWDRCSWWQVGINSIANSRNYVAGPYIYTKVSHYIDWIQSVVWPQQ